MYIRKCFTWDDSKARSNLIKHGVSFEEACVVFEDKVALVTPGKETSALENRFIRIGIGHAERIILVVYTLRKNSNEKEIIRIISARPASKKERSVYTGL